jgi:hypothetical protein
MGIPATLSVTEMGSESQMVTEKIMLYLAEWHRRLEDRAVDVDQLRQQMRVKKEEQRGDQNDEDSDEDESGGGSRFAPLIDSSDLVKQPAPKVGRPPVPAVPSISPRAALVGSSNALPSPQSSPRGSAASKAASLPTKGPPPRGPSPRPPARPAGDPPARPASDLSSCGTNSPLIATKIDDMARSTGSVVIPPYVSSSPLPFFF